MTTPAELRARGRLGAFTMHSRHDGRAVTQKARDTFRRSFERQVPDDVTNPQERARRAEMLRKAHYARMAMASAKTRARKAGK